MDEFELSICNIREPNLREYEVLGLALLNNALECADEEWFDTRLARSLIQYFEKGIPVVSEQVKAVKDMYVHNDTKTVCAMTGKSASLIESTRLRNGWWQNTRKSRKDFVPVGIKK